MLKCSLRYTHLSTVIRCAIISAYDYFNERKIILDLVKQIGSEQIRTDLPQLNIGDTVRVYVKVKEGNRKGFKCLKASLFRKNTVELTKHLP